MNSRLLSFDEIYQEFHLRIHRVLSRMVGEDEAADLTQEVFIKVDRALSTFRGESELSTWIFRVAANTALDRFRSPSYRGGQGKISTLEEIEEKGDNDNFQFDEAMASMDQRIIRQEMNGCIREIIDSLPEDYRSVIVLSELEGFKDQEIGGILGITLPLVKIRLHRGRALLKKELSKACVFFRDERNEFVCDRKSGDIQLAQLKNRP